MVQQAVLDGVEDPELTVHVVWTPVLASDDFDSAVKAQEVVSDPRAVHYWDGDQSLGKAYTSVVTLPEDNNRLAWDIYFVYEPGATWNEAPPSPTTFWHQLAFDDGYLGDGMALRDALKVH